MYKSLIKLVMFFMLATGASSVQRIVFYDTDTGQFLTITNGLANTNTYFSALDVGNLSVTTNGITVTNNWGWEDLRFPSGTFTLKPNNTDVTDNEANNSTTFETGCSTNLLTDDHIYGVAQFPHTYRTGSVVSAHVHFEQYNADQTNCWYMYYRNHPLGGEKRQAWIFIGAATNHFAYTAGTNHQMAVFTDITMTGMVESSIMDWKMFRDGAAGTGDIELKEFDIHYQIEKLTGEIFN